MFVRVDGDADPLGGREPTRAMPVQDRAASQVNPEAEATPADAIESAQPDPLAYDPSAVERFSFESGTPSQHETQTPPELAAFNAEGEAGAPAPTAAVPVHETLADVGEPSAAVDASAVMSASGEVASAADGDPAADEPPREHFSFEPLPITPAFDSDVLPLASFVPPPMESTAAAGPPRAAAAAMSERARAAGNAQHDPVAAARATGAARETAAGRASRSVRNVEHAGLPRHAPGLHDLPAAGRAIAFSGASAPVAVRRRSYRWPLAAAAILLLAAAAAVPWVFLVREGATVSFAPSRSSAAEAMADDVAPPPADVSSAADPSGPAPPDETLRHEAPIDAPAEPASEPPPAAASSEPAEHVGTGAGSATDAGGSTETPSARGATSERVTRDEGTAPREAPERRELTGRRVADVSPPPARPRPSPGRPLEPRTAASGSRVRVEQTPANAAPSASAPAPTPIRPDPELVSEAPTSELAAVDAPPPPSPPPSPAASPTAAASTGSSTAAPVSAAVSDEQLVSAALQRYARAYERLDATAARRVWPNVDERALARAFETLESQQFRFDSCRVRVLGQTARADCAGAVTYVPKVGKKDPRTVERRWDFALRKGPDAWQITEATVR